MKTAVYSTRSYDRDFLAEANRSAGSPHELSFIETHLDRQTARMADGHAAICVFVNDVVDSAALAVLSEAGVRIAALRCAGFNNVDVAAAQDAGIALARVPAYSPDAIAEHTLALILCLNRKIHRAYARVREGNFALEGLLGFDLKGKVAGIVGTGQIGLRVAAILHGFGCEVIASDPSPSRALAEAGGRYVGMEELLARSDIVSLHCPLTPGTKHLIDEPAIAAMKPGVMLINTSRGAVVHAQALIGGLKSGRIGHVGLDVYEEEGDLFFEDLSGRVLQDDVFARLLTFPNVLITGHQGFFTREAMDRHRRNHHRQSRPLRGDGNASASGHDGDVARHAAVRLAGASGAVWPVASSSPPLS